MKAFVLDEIPGLEGQGYIFTRNGMVQFLGQGSRKGMIVAATYAAAKKLAKTFKRRGNPMSIAVVGTIPGETLAGQIRSSFLNAGATGFFLACDGDTLQFVTPSIG